MLALYLPLTLIVPFVLWPIERFLPYPHIIEEIAKLLLVWNVANYENSKIGVIMTITMGILFTLSETAIHSYNLFFSGGFIQFANRVVLTGLLHSLTFVLLFVTIKINKKLAPLGLLIAVVIHYAYNLRV
jgi:hypothetical protein